MENSNLQTELESVRKAIAETRIQFERLVGAEQILLGMLEKYGKDTPTEAPKN